MLHTFKSFYYFIFDIFMLVLPLRGQSKKPIHTNMLNMLVKD